MRPTYCRLRLCNPQVSAAGNPYNASDMSHVLHNDSSSVLIDAKRELQKEKALLASLKQQTQNNSNKDGEDAEMEDAENGREESMSEDDSDDDSDRKGMIKTIPSQ